MSAPFNENPNEPVPRSDQPWQPPESQPQQTPPPSDPYRTGYGQPQPYYQPGERPASQSNEYRTGYGNPPHNPEGQSQNAPPQPSQQQQQQQGYGAPLQQSIPQYAGVAIRFLALLIDSVIIAVIGGVLGSLADSTTVATAISVIIMFAYFIIFEALRGATPGKMLFKLHVVRTDGAPISWQESFIRNLLRIIDGLFVYLVAAIFVWTSPLRQRLGDRAANTVVVQQGYSRVLTG